MLTLSRTSILSLQHVGMTIHEVLKILLGIKKKYFFKVEDFELERNVCIQFKGGILVKLD